MSLQPFLNSSNMHQAIKETVAKYGLTMAGFLEDAAAEKLAKHSEYGEKVLRKLGLLIEDAKVKAFETERKDAYWEAFDDDKLKRQIEAGFLWTKYFDWESATDGVLREETDDEMWERLKKFDLA